MFNKVTILKIVDCLKVLFFFYQGEFVKKNKKNEILG
jgi:hypothetical protein